MGSDVFAYDLNLLALSLMWLVVTLMAYTLALTLYRRSNGNALLHPLVVTVLVVGSVIAVFQVPVQRYVAATQLLHWLLGPATVALAVPLYRQLYAIRSVGVPLIAAILAGGLSGPVVCALILSVFDAPRVLVLTSLTKSITTPLAMATAPAIGGVASVAAVMVIATGIMGAVCADALFRLLHCNDERVRGVALGTAAHAVGTSHAMRYGEQATAFSSLALCINGVVTALLLPVMFTMWA